MYEDFDYCVWLCPDDHHPWNQVIGSNGPRAHLSARTRLPTLSDARRACRACGGGADVDVRLAGDLCQTVTGQGFHALEHAVEPAARAPPPAWWPDGAHVSFGYRYDRPFTEDEIHAVRRQLAAHRTARLHAPRAVRCTGHWAAWHAA